MPYCIIQFLTQLDPKTLRAPLHRPFQYVQMLHVFTSPKRSKKWICKRSHFQWYVEMLSTQNEMGTWWYLDMLELLDGLDIDNYILWPTGGFNLKKDARQIGSFSLEIGVKNNNIWKPPSSDKYNMCVSFFHSLKTNIYMYIYIDYILYIIYIYSC